MDKTLRDLKEDLDYVLHAKHLAKYKILDILLEAIKK